MTRIFRIFCFALLAAVCGCVNYMTRNDNTESPYVCAPHPYYCTWQVMGCLAVPFSEPEGPEGRISQAYATIFFPVFLIDLPFEIVLDTVFLPVDGIYALCKDKPEQPQGEAEKVQEVR